MVKIHSIETLGALDGPGIRTVLFFQGCPLRCAYCHNADTLSCDGGVEYDERELAKFCARYKSYYGHNGGVTLSGGEPLLQQDGVLRLIQALKAEGIHVALDTSGAVFAPDILAECDLVMLDIKHTNAEKYEWLTGGKLENTLKTLEFCQKNAVPFWVRQVVLKDFTDSKEQLLRLKELSVGADKIELLPYHAMGVEKWERLGLEYRLKNVEETNAATVEKLSELI